MLRSLWFLLLVGCVGDSTVVDAGGVDASDASNAVDATSDVATEAGADAGSDASSCPPPSTSLTSGCNAPKIACLTQTQTTCVAPSQCSYIGGGRQLLCGSVADCDGGAACCTTASVTSSGCPTVISLNGSVSNIGTQCSTNTTKACPGGSEQVCVTSGECFSGTCQGAIFDVNGQKVVKLGLCQ